MNFSFFKSCVLRGCLLAYVEKNRWYTSGIRIEVSIKHFSLTFSTEINLWKNMYSTETTYPKNVLTYYHSSGKKKMAEFVRS